MNALGLPLAGAVVNALILLSGLVGRFILRHRRHICCANPRGAPPAPAAPESSLFRLLALPLMQQLCSVGFGACANAAGTPALSTVPPTLTMIAHMDFWPECVLRPWRRGPLHFSGRNGWLGFVAGRSSIIVQSSGECYFLGDKIM